MNRVANSTRRVVVALVVAAYALLFAAWKLENYVLALIVVVLAVSAVIMPSKRRLEYFLSFLVIILMLGSFEVLLPFLDDSAEEKTHWDGHSSYLYGYYKHVDGFGYIPRSGVYASREISRDGEEIYNVTYTIGKDGYRDTEFPGEADDYLFGGSFVFGEGLSDDETLTHFLWNDHSLAVKNVGIHGYGLQQALYNIEHGVGANNGVNILLTAPWHALRSACKPIYSAGTPKYAMEGGYAKLSGVCPGQNIYMKILGRSNVYNRLRAVFTDDFEIRDGDVDLYLAIIRSIEKETRAHGSRLLVAYIKATGEQMKFTRYTNESILSEIRKISDGVVDVTLAKDRESLPGKYYIHKLDQHPTALANRERAALIFDALSKLKSDR